MARIASGAITITDITDGADPISAFLTNENHTFSASTSGTVPPTEITAFSSSVQIFVGGTAGVFQTAAVGPSTTKGRFNIANPASVNGWNVDVTSAGVLSLTSAGTTNSQQVNVVTTIATGAGTVSVTLVLTLSRVNAGSGGEIITLSASKQTFTFNNAGTALSPSVQPNVSFIYTGTKTAGSTVDFRQIVTSSSDTVISETALVSGIARTTVTSASTTFSGTITMEETDFSPNNIYTVKVRILNGSTVVAEDSISVVKVQEGNTGANAVNVKVVSSNGDTFKNAAGTAKTLTAEIRDAVDGSLITHVGTASGQTSVHYDWRIGEVNGSVVRLDSGTRNVKSTSSVPDTTGGSTATGTGTSFSTIIVGAEDVVDGSTQQFSCIVTITDN